MATFNRAKILTVFCTMHFNQNPNRRRLLFYLIFLLLPIYGFAFQKTLYTSELYEQIILTNQEFLSFNEIELIDDISSYMDEKDIDFFEALSLKLNVQLDYDSLGISGKAKTLELRNVEGNNVVLEHINIDSVIINSGSFQSLIVNAINTNHLTIDSLNFSNELVIQESYIGTFSSFKNVIDHFEVFGNEFTHYFETNDIVIADYWILESRFKEGAFFGTETQDRFFYFRLEASDFESIDSEMSFPLDFYGRENDSLIMKNQAAIDLKGKVDQAVISENVFDQDSVDQFITIHGEFDYLIISANTIGSILHPTATVTKQFIMDDNLFDSNFIFVDLILEGRNNILRWSEIAGYKLASTVEIGQHVSEQPEQFGYSQDDLKQIINQTGGYLQRTYRAQSDVELEDLEPFQRLLSSYYRLYTAFKENGDLDQANEVYVEMKDVQLKELSYQYKNYGGLENWIEWRLNYILKIYTDYGTKPAKAIRLSVWVIALFSVFYFFFPSEWDTKSKTQLIADYKTFIKKNDHGYFKPFVKLSFGFSKSLVNAFTLSLNSFVTLGFGTIPTSGLARYVCILQGFLGWFLLSIFTASLINQVLF